MSQRAQAIAPSPIRRFFDMAENMEGVISLGVGEPDFRTPWTIRSAAINTLERQAIFYGANSGLLQLRQEISRFMERKYQLSYCPENELLVTIGGSEAVDLTFRTLINPGDEVLITEPCFVCYAPLVSMADGVPVSLPTKEENEFRLTAAELKEKITPKTKLLVLSYPNNPTGAIMRREDYEEITALLRDTDIFVLSDEIYSEMTYGTKHVSIAGFEGMRERTIVVNGFSKTFAMTGWRLGWMAAPPEIIAEARKIHQYGIMCAPMVSQRAAIEALKHCESDCADMIAEYDRRRRFLLERFSQMGLRCFPAQGAFYLFPSIESSGMDSESFCEQLLQEERVAVVPGSAFGACGKNNIRISYAYSLKHLAEAADRMEHFLSKHHK
ncbi:MAG: aminotransferase class I/II-fold pyridoxal phosphate-dependent enzyme [Oscillospiraceae bacterium]|nr:aminotransferase class I/II-fold pyridoxal phosphate-dependent enzyme [Oscillospiraceae bacterium]MCR4759433.1 aminotransferase class I/II-fold pyridoxal phosphate-dependent enzyme [Oscillospiraceae bacterium]